MLVSTVLSRALSCRTSGDVGAVVGNAGGHTSMLTHLCDVTRERTVHVGDDCVVTDLVCDAPLHVTRFFRHQDPHAFWPRDLGV